MSKGRKRIIKLVFTLVAGGFLVAALVLFKTVPADAHIPPQPCDFTTGGGFVITGLGAHANFGLVAGCKNGGFFGHVNVVNHDTTGPFAGLHVSSTQITGYLDACINGCGNPPRYRDICGIANTNLFGQVFFRARTLDVAEPGSGPNGPDRFGIKICKGGVCSTDAIFTPPWLPTRFLQGGNMQLHKPNPSTFYNGPTDESTLCNGVNDTGLGT